MFYAHSGNDVNRSDWQPLAEHLEATAELAAHRAQPLGLKETARLAGLYHDLGKYDPSFDAILRGQNIRLDHSTAGGVHLMNQTPAQLQICAEVLAYAILGHHAGLPDRRGGDAGIERRRDGFRSGLDPAHIPPGPDLAPVAAELQAKMQRNMAAFDLSLATRVIFSCLVDADFRDTEAFYDALNGRSSEREWPALADLLPEWRQAYDAHMAGFSADTTLNRRRTRILDHVRRGAEMSPGLFTLTVPTGGGRTLASLGFALDHAARRHALPRSGGWPLRYIVNWRQTSAGTGRFRALL